MASSSSTSRVLLKVAVFLLAAVGLTGAGAATAYFVWGKPPIPAFTQESPSDVLKAAVDMVKAGRADQLPTLIYAESPEMRVVLQRLGGLTGSLQELAGVLSKRFPQQVAQYRKDAEEAMKSDQGKSVMTALLQGQRPTGTPSSPQDQQTTFEQTAMRILADPFSWLEQGAGRLTTVEVADDTAAILFDGAPIAGVGLTMKKVGTKWFVQIPTNLPGVSRYMPQTRNEWSIVANLIKVLDNAMKDLAVEVNAGRVNRMEQLAEKVGEMAFPPAAMVAIVYAKEMDVRARREKSLTDFRKRWTAWVRDNGMSIGDESVQKRLAEAVNKLAIEELDKIIRADVAVVKGVGTKTLPKFDGMPATTFEATIEGWLLQKSIKFSLASPPGEPEFTKVIEKINAPALAANRRR